MNVRSSYLVSVVARSRFRRRGRPAPYAAAEARHMDHGVVGGIEFDPLDVGERQLIEGLPGFPVVTREPEARAGRVFGQCHVNPAVVFRMEIAAESLRPFAPDALPSLAAVVGEVEAAGLVAASGVRRAEQDAPAVARINREILGRNPWVSAKSALRLGWLDPSVVRQQIAAGNQKSAL